MAVAKVGPSGLPIPMGGIMETLEGGKGYFGPTRVGPLPGGTISNPFKALINLMSKKDDDDIIDVKEEELIKLDKKDVSTGGENPDEDPKKKTTIKPLSAEEVAKKLMEEGVGEVIDKGVEKLKGKYKDLDKQKQFELEQADPVNLEKRKSPDLTDEQRETAAKNVQLQVDKKRERYQQYIPIIIKIFNENPDLKLVSRNPDEETLTTLIQKEIGPVTKAGGQITKDTIASILESSGLREKKLGSVPLETKEKIVNYLLQDNNYKTMSSKQVVKNLNLDIGHSTVSELRRKGFPGVSIEGYENQKLVPDSKSRTALAKARSLFDAMIKSDYPDISREEQNKLRVTFSDYISDAFDTGKKEGFTKKQIAEAYSYVTQERMFPTLEEQFYQDFFAQLRAENEKTFDVINQIREFEGKEPLGGFKQFMKEYPDLFLTMGHTGREDPKQGKVGGFDLRNVEYQTLADNKYANERYKELKSAWGNDETPDNIELFLEIAYDLVARDIRQVFEIPKSGETIIIGRQEPKPFPSEDEFFRFGDKKEIDFKKDGGIVGISHLIRSL
jgi:hypothetical protein|tara:strand:- start:65 stop:1738 length:1674 start_codon:yes stop_codon:yes gene_type:complete